MQRDALGRLRRPIRNYLGDEGGGSHHLALLSSPASIGAAGVDAREGDPGVGERKGRKIRALNPRNVPNDPPGSPSLAPRAMRATLAGVTVGLGPGGRTPGSAASP